MVIYSVNRLHLHHYFDYIWLVFGKSNEILPNSELLIILFGFDINY
jgi:hypothetical protein